MCCSLCCTECLVSLCRCKCAVKCSTFPLLPAGETAGLHEKNGFQRRTGKENDFRTTGEALQHNNKVVTQFKSIEMCRIRSFLWPLFFLSSAQAASKQKQFTLTDDNHSLNCMKSSLGGTPNEQNHATTCTLGRQKSCWKLKLSLSAWYFSSLCNLKKIWNLN